MVKKRTKKTGPVARYGARYGATLRKRYLQIEKSLRASYPCPKCGAIKVKRVSIGIWQCRKCNYTFAGGAYTPQVEIKKE